MIDKKFLNKENIKYIKKILIKRNFYININKILILNNNKRYLQFLIENIRRKNIIYSKKKNLKYEYIKLFLKNKVNYLNKFLFILLKKFNFIKNIYYNYVISIPNIPDNSIINLNKNKIIKIVGKKPIFNFKIKDHIDIGLNLGLNLKNVINIINSGFMILEGFLAKLNRALIKFMLDIHINQNGYKEYYLPYITNEKNLINTGQLPKFKNNLFTIKKKFLNNNIYLIPTGEVPLVNLNQNKIINLSDLPIKYVTHTPCFRLENINYGQNSKGIIRQYQFDKIELVQIVKPEDSNSILNIMIKHIEIILKKLNLPYRIIELFPKELSFASSKTFDIEVWLPSKNKYQEISSISNCKDYQSKRINIKFKDKYNKLYFPHILNGSGIAIGRTIAALLENCQQSDGSIILPKVILPYMK